MTLSSMSRRYICNLLRVNTRCGSRSLDHRLRIKSEISATISDNLLFDKECAKYRRSLPMWLLSRSIICRFVHRLPINPGDNTRCSHEYQNSSPVESTSLTMSSPDDAPRRIKIEASVFRSKAEKSLSSAKPTTGNIGLRKSTPKSGLFMLVHCVVSPCDSMSSTGPRLCENTPLIIAQGKDSRKPFPFMPSPGSFERHWPARRCCSWWGPG